MSDKCKHEKAAEGATFCPECGEQLSSERGDFIRDLAEAVYQRQKKGDVKGGEEDDDETLLDRVTGKKKKGKK